MMTSKTASYIGLAQRAGGAIYGEDKIVEQKRKIKLVLVDSSAPEKYSERLRRRLEGMQIVVLEGLKDALHRDNVNAVGITNDGLANAIIVSLR